MAHILDKGQMLERSDNICPIGEFRSKWVGGVGATPRGTVQGKFVNCTGGLYIYALYL